MDAWATGGPRRGGAWSAEDRGLAAPRSSGIFRGWIPRCGSWRLVPQRRTLRLAGVRMSAVASRAARAMSTSCQPSLDGVLFAGVRASSGAEA